MCRNDPCLSFSSYSFYIGIGAGLESMTVDKMDWIQKVNPRVC